MSPIAYTPIMRLSPMPQRGKHFPPSLILAEVFKIIQILVVLAWGNNIMRSTTFEGCNPKFDDQIDIIWGDEDYLQLNHSKAAIVC